MCANFINHALILIIVSIIREVLGSGSIMNISIFPASMYVENGGWYVNNGLMLLAPGAFIALGLLIWIQRTVTHYTEE